MNELIQITIIVLPRKVNVFYLFSFLRFVMKLDSVSTSSKKMIPGGPTSRVCRVQTQSI